MTKTAYLNGQYVPQDQALVSAEDRGFTFADGVYEVVRYYAGRPLGMAAHIKRLIYSLAQLRIDLPGPADIFSQISDELIARNQTPDAYVYWQVTRGAALRDHRFPDPPVRPTVYASVKPMPPLDPDAPPTPMSAITYPEIRWSRCAIKSVSLLPNVLARQAAHEAGCDEAIFVRDDNIVTEGTARSIMMVKDLVAYTYPLDGTILGSITREMVIELAAGRGIEIREHPFTHAQMIAADEVFAVGTTTQVRPIVQVDQQKIGPGDTGPITLGLAKAYTQRVLDKCGL